MTMAFRSSKLARRSAAERSGKTELDRFSIRNSGSVSSPKVRSKSPWLPRSATPSRLRAFGERCAFSGAVASRRARGRHPRSRLRRNVLDRRCVRRRRPHAAPDRPSRIRPHSTSESSPAPGAHPAPRACVPRIAVYCSKTRSLAVRNIRKRVAGQPAPIVIRQRSSSTRLRRRHRVPASPARRLHLSGWPGC